MCEPTNSKIIKDECNKRNIPYGSFDKFRSLYVHNSLPTPLHVCVCVCTLQTHQHLYHRYASHVSTLRRLGNSDKFD